MRYIILDGSHASRIADSLDDLGLIVIDLSVPCRLDSHREKHQESGCGACRTAYGSRLLPVKIDARYHHMVGALKMADREDSTQLERDREIP
jgi:hypothetical protein